MKSKKTSKIAKYDKENVNFNLKRKIGEPNLKKYQTEAESDFNL